MIPAARVVDRNEPARPVPWWAIAVPIVAGILAVIVVGILLWIVSLLNLAI